MQTVHVNPRNLKCVCDGKWNDHTSLEKWHNSSGGGGGRFMCVCVCVCVCVLGEMWQLQTCVRPVSRRRNGTTLLRTRGTGANVAVGSHQASPNQECSSVSAAATFAVRMIYPDTRTTASPNSYHRLRRWAFQRSKGVCVCAREK